MIFFMIIVLFLLFIFFIFWLGVQGSLGHYSFTHAYCTRRNSPNRAETCMPL